MLHVPMHMPLMLMVQGYHDFSPYASLPFPTSLNGRNVSNFVNIEMALGMLIKYYKDKNKNIIKIEIYIYIY